MLSIALACLFPVTRRWWNRDLPKRQFAKLLCYGLTCLRIRNIVSLSIVLSLSSDNLHEGFIVSYDAKVYNVMIASPGDVASERNIVREILYEWNTVNSMQRNMVLLPLTWETHMSPEMGTSPQEIINKRILNKCDLLVGVFWTRVGTATGGYASGTVEEIEKHLKSGKPTMLYFSNQPVHPDTVDTQQIGKLKDFKKSCQKRGLCEAYDSYSDFKQKLYRQLQIKINQDGYFRVVDQNLEIPTVVRPSESNVVALSHEGRVLLKEASMDEHGAIIHVKTLGGTTIQTNGKNMVAYNDPRDIAKWESALNELITAKLIVDQGYKGELFDLTDLGYRMADTIEL